MRSTRIVHGIYLTRYVNHEVEHLRTIFDAMTTEVVATEDGLGYYVHVGNRRAFVSSMHLVPDKEAQLTRLNKES